MFSLWRRHLRLNEIFEDLHTEITSATQYLFNRAASRSARTGQRLSVIATLGVIAGLAFAFLGMNVFQTDTLGSVLADIGVHDPVKESPFLQFAIVVWILTIFTIPASLGLVLFGWSGRRRGWVRRGIGGRESAWRPRTADIFRASTFDLRFALSMVLLALPLLIGSILLYFRLRGGPVYPVVTDYS